MRYDLYHDESKEDGYWHGMLLVSQSTRADLLSLLSNVRENTGYAHPVTLKGLTKTSGRKFRTIQAWLSIAVASLVQDEAGLPTEYYTGQKARRTEIVRLTELINARFILFRVKEGHQQLSGYPDHASRIETTFRMGMKGGLHLFATADDPLILTSLHFDGYEHRKRRIDRQRIVGRLGELRDPVTVPEELLVDDRRSDHRDSDSQAYADCQLLQLTDLLVSGFRTILGPAGHPAQVRVTRPLRRLSDRWHEGPARMRNSRWHRGFAISECYLDGDTWEFSDIGPEFETRQESLFGEHPGSTGDEDE